VLGYVLRRVLWMIPTFLGITLVCFALMHLAPGDPAEMRYSSGEEGAALGRTPGESALARWRADHLLDDALARQYLHFVGPFDLSPRGAALFGGSGERTFGGLLALDLGHELLRPEVSIAAQIGTRISVTAPLALAAILGAYALALAYGTWAALRRGRALAQAAELCVFLLYSLPPFWAALCLQLVFGYGGLEWLPTLGISASDSAALPPLERALDVVLHSILPVVCLSYAGFAYLARQTRAAMLEALESDAVRAARAKGLPERVVIRKHALRSALLPSLTLFGGLLPALVGGSVIVEFVFDLPGMGRYAYEGLVQRDYGIVLATTALSAAATLLAMLVSDLLCAWADPRLRHG
jgi:peptide/nickel transport system permease protein